jgi:hypothetical protein
MRDKQATKAKGKVSVSGDMVNKSQNIYTRSKWLKFHIEKNLGNNENLRSELNLFNFFKTLPLQFPSASTLKFPLSNKTSALAADNQNGSSVKPA